MGTCDTCLEWQDADCKMCGRCIQKLQDKIRNRTFIAVLEWLERKEFYLLRFTASHCDQSIFEDKKVRIVKECPSWRSAHELADKLNEENKKKMKREKNLRR